MGLHQIWKYGLLFSMISIALFLFITIQVLGNVTFLGVRIPNLNISTSSFINRHVFTTVANYNIKRYDAILDENIQVFSTVAKRNITTAKLVKDTHVFSAVANLNITSLVYDGILIHIWNKNKSTTFTCCIKTQSGGLSEGSAVIMYQSIKYNNIDIAKTIYAAKAYKCSFPNADNGQQSVDDIPEVTEVTLRRDEEHCKDKNDYVKVHFPKQHLGKLAICVKAAYGHLDPMELIGWLEFHRRYGVDHFVVLVDYINKPAMDVLNYYNSIALLDVINFTFPSHLNLNVRIGNNKISYQRLAIFDCGMRVMGYSYAGFLDFDEYIFPKKYTSLKKLFQNQKTNKPISVITFHVEYFFEEWGTEKPNDTVRPFWYFNRTSTSFYRMKSIYIPDRVEFPNGNLHYFNSKTNFSSLYVSKEVATIHHYRKCPTNLWHQFGNCTETKRFIDKQMLHIKDELKSKMSSIASEISRT